MNYLGITWVQWWENVSSLGKLATTGRQLPTPTTNNYALIIRQLLLIMLTFTHTLNSSFKFSLSQNKDLYPPSPTSIITTII